MPLEGIAALSLASNVIQLVEFGIKISELTHHLREHCGELPKDLQRVETLINYIVPISQRLQDASISSSNQLLQEQTLVPLLEGCRHEANQFQFLLDSLKVTSQSGWKSFLLALKTTRKAGKLRNIEKALESYKTSMTLRLADASLAKQYVSQMDILYHIKSIQGIHMRISQPDPAASKLGSLIYSRCLATPGP